MRQLAVAPLILLPTELDSRIVGINVVLPFLKMRRQRDLSFDARNDCGFDQLRIAIATGFEPIDLAPQSGLAPIQPPRIQKDGPTNLLVVPCALRLLQDADRDEVT